jgi:hypothetical protein
VREQVIEGSEVHTDALMSYDDLSKDYDRKIVDHMERYVDRNVHTNCLDNFWSLLKRCLKGTYVNRKGNGIRERTSRAKQAVEPFICSDTAMSGRIDSMSANIRTATEADSWTSGESWQALTI